ncbi:MAG: TolB family protein, partial [Actinomycetota bacterium]
VHEVGGSQPDRQITFGKRHKSLPVWSPDGTRLAYVRVTNVGIRLEVAHIDLSKPSPLTDVTIITPSGKTDWCPDWHPTANRIVVERHAPSFETSEIVVINLKTGAGRRLTDDRFADELCPAFSPDGEHVVVATHLRCKNRA